MHPAVMSRRIVRVRGARGTKEQSSSKPTTLRANIPFHLSPRPLFTPHIMDSLLCDIINHSRKQKGNKPSSSPVLILNEPWDEHERKIGSKRNRGIEELDISPNIDATSKENEVRLPRCVSPLDLRAYAKPFKRRKCVTAEELVGLDEQVADLRLSSKVHSCALPSNLLQGKSTMHTMTIGVCDQPKDAHILAFKTWQGLGMLEPAPPVVEDLELTSVEEASLGKCMLALTLGGGDKGTLSPRIGVTRP